MTSSLIVACIMLWEGMPKCVSYIANASRVYFYQAKTRPAESGKYFRSITLVVHAHLYKVSEVILRGMLALLSIPINKFSFFIWML